MKRILLTGVNGQLGQDLQRTLAGWGEVTGTGREQMDLAQPAQIRHVIEELKPEVIINTAAYTAVDQAETETEKAKALNAIAPSVIAELAQQQGAALVHLSTDYVFDGSKNTPYTEEDTPNPVSVYGQSKLAGEQAVRANCDRHLILRTAWVYGACGKKNFVKTMLRVGAEREELRVVADQVGTPSWTGEIASAITQLLPPNPNLTGTYHFTNSGVASWYDFAIAIFEEAQQLGFPLKVQRVVPLTTPEYPTPAQRPPYSVLSTQKISSALGTRPSHWRQGLRKMLKELYAQQQENVG
ncbi:MAG: dTDP-4-dehydrorhamnose reductase [Cyanobacteria bacterium QS_7_48_42]|jgi:dTDP-4-dehydrorhamnose reductase|nr:MAG: dTDP-4-dehydrorhamnose reductase [Cyanobacteria bacterium QH_10_48_56]PSO64541.1 MAG: dTDP-4-dehydrorhamnose reductase [Cyanobacteria bacterium QH_7_48_89]PSO70031.1 MAG: dTDP-4-dehydrorhamnose reductase [Cyanobacteria bacterium QH_3_48_40]PSO85491.1 MAG: dTDP-4-dehydrorhamnose reductase [Cyanobacteria bacterium QS_5_48_63]PSO91771.1 MAG: dTDP-4-dehydrorhamnose reductase [Cyanobacteria bacterium QS_3_48_167]PSO93569.1 MAG: dTDP-4-dehydrorhamnose reductase [Cyanobacteria bacterium QS_6_